MYHAPAFANGDTRKQLARSIYLFYNQLIDSVQRIRAEILFIRNIPMIKKDIIWFMRLGLIYHQCKFKDIT